MVAQSPNPIAAPTKPEELANLPGHHVELAGDEPMPLDNGGSLSPLRISYTTAGALNQDRTNAILICHALTGDQYFGETHPVTGKPGWWESLIGPGKPIDTDRFFVICSNVLGGCMGSFGPLDINPETGEAFGTKFPVITIGDMVRAQALLIDHLGIDSLFAVIGGSMGGMQVLEWAVRYPERVFAAIPIATAVYHTAQNIAFDEVGRQAVMADPDWLGGNYLAHGKRPRNGLAVARMAAHITYLSEAALQRKFGRNLQDRPDLTFGFEADFQVESYLRHQGSTFVERFDANSYLYITRAMDYFDLCRSHGGQLSKLFQGTPVRFCVVSFTSDWLFPTSESLRLVHALNGAGANVTFSEIETDKGHDAFLLDEPQFEAVIQGFVDGAARARGLLPALAETTPAEPAKTVQDPTVRADIGLIGSLIKPRSTVLDIGCGDGALLVHLRDKCEVSGRGIEIDQGLVQTAVGHGLTVIQGDAEQDLEHYPADSVDYAVLGQTLQAMSQPRVMLEEMLRVAHYAIISFQNFGHWRVRASLGLSGRMPVTSALPHSWYNTPNIHFFTINDFIDLADDMGLKIDAAKVIMDRHLAGSRVVDYKRLSRWHNLLGEQAVFKVSQG
ncbi:MAG: homoserine O-acetyltransferase [Alphaproteobacteria bacterium]|nr:homoserine O-acetyltransferase [Alphaproteobacteria bacterium SS10]